MDNQHPELPPVGGPDARSEEDLQGRVLKDRYHIDQFIARGGMGSVYRANDRESTRVVAVKLLDVLPNDPLYRRRFFNEAAIAAQLKHPQSVDVLDYGSEDDLCFIVMEFLEGYPLPAHLRSLAGGRLSARHALRVITDLCNVLETAHAIDIVHRDLKPSNLYVTREDDRGPCIKVLDFGLAMRTNRDTRLTVPGTLLGSPRYMSPEQLHGKPVDHRTDIYNMGLVLHRMLTGRDAFSGKEQSEVLIAQATKSPTRLSEYPITLPQSEALQWLVDACTQKAPDKRFSSVAKVRSAVERIEEGLDDDNPLDLHNTLADLSPLVAEAFENLEPEPTGSLQVTPKMLVAGAVALMMGGMFIGVACTAVAVLLLR